MPKKNNPHIGSDVLADMDKKLKDPEFKREYEKARLQLAIGSMVRRISQQKKLSIRALAKKMHASPAQIERLFADKNVSLDTLAKFAAATGKTVSVKFR